MSKGNARQGIHVFMNKKPIAGNNEMEKKPMQARWKTWNKRQTKNTKSKGFKCNWLFILLISLWRKSPVALFNISEFYWFWNISILFASLSQFFSNLHFLLFYFRFGCSCFKRIIYWFYHSRYDSRLFIIFVENTTIFIWKRLKDLHLFIS